MSLADLAMEGFGPVPELMALPPPPLVGRDARMIVPVVGVALPGRASGPQTLWVPGVPRPKGSMKGWAAKKAGVFTGHVGMAPANPKSQSWEGVLATVAVATGLRIYPLPTPLELALTFYFVRPKSHYGSGKKASVLRPDAPRFPVQFKKNDIDKLVRCVLDGLDGVLYEDDAQIVTLGRTRRRWALPDRGPGVEIRIMEAEED